MVESIIAFDPSTHCGWAFRAADESVGSGVFDLPPSNSNTDGARLRRFQNWLNKMLDVVVPEIVVYERMFIPAARSRGGKLLIKIEGIIQTTCDDGKTDLEVVAPTALKKFATGKGQKVSKEEMIAAARKKWPKHLYNRKVVPDDEAEALLLLAWAIENMT